MISEMLRKKYTLEICIVEIDVLYVQSISEMIKVTLLIRRNLKNWTGHEPSFETGIAQINQWNNEKDEICKLITGKYLIKITYELHFILEKEGQIN